VTIPLHPGLSQEDVEDVIGAVAEIVAKFRA
jgi:dTDP-4-amino-4,6-dideoxygalactose transaminase